MTADGFRCEVLTVETTPVRDGLDVEYRADSRGAETLTVRYPFALGHADLETLPALALGLGVYLAQLCLARRLVVTPAPTAKMVQDLLPVIAALYDVRRWMDELSLDGLPEVHAVDGRSAPLRGTAPIERTATLLFSGGKDSTLAAMVLKANGFDVSPLHLSVNAGVQEQERNAARRISEDIGLSLTEVDVTHPDFLAFSDAYALNWNTFPRSNSVPFGRDLLTSLLAIPGARQARSAVLSLGHDNECRNATVAYRGKVIPRNDVECSAIAVSLERFVNEHLLRIGLLPPLAGVSELMILRTMLLEHPNLMRQTSSCFWGDNCGRCAKCLRYYLADRVFGTDILRFRRNPLALGVCPELEDLLDANGARSTLFQTAVLWCLGTLAARQDVRDEETALQRFAQLRLVSVRDELDAWQEDLLALHADPQLPPSFRYSTSP